MLQLMVVYFGPYFIFGITTPKGYRFLAVIIGFVLNYAAYFAEIYPPELNPCQPDNMRRHSYWAIIKPRHLSE